MTRKVSSRRNLSRRQSLAVMWVALTAVWCPAARGVADNTSDAKTILGACQNEFAAHSNLCNQFVNAVATDLGFHLFSGKTADGIIDALIAASGTSGTGWQQLSDGDGNSAQDGANKGLFVIGGLESSELTPKRANGHVVVVVTGSLDANGYPFAYWGMKGGVGQAGASLRKAFNGSDASRVHYFTAPLSTAS